MTRILRMLDIFLPNRLAPFAFSLGDKNLAKDYETLAKLTDQLKETQEMIESLAGELFLALHGSPILYSSPNLKHVDDRVEFTARHLEEEFLLKSELGRKIVTLREERENLLDAVWLATTNRQIKDLWSQVSNILGEKPTGLQKQAIKQESLE